MRAIALDIGDKRIGIAVSEPTFNMALPYQTYNRRGKELDCKYIAELAAQKKADVIVCGIPYNADGTNSYQTDKTRRFIELLKEYTDIKIAEEDERYTTAQAESILLEADMRREKRKQVIDKVAASYILESFLSKQKKES